MFTPYSLLVLSLFYTSTLQAPPAPLPPPPPQQNILEFGYANSRFPFNQVIQDSLKLFLVTHCKILLYIFQPNNVDFKRQQQLAQQPQGVQQPQVANNQKPISQPPKNQPPNSQWPNHHWPSLLAPA